MGVAVLNPEDCLKHHFSKQTLIFPTKWNHPKNPTSNRTNRSPPNWKKRSPNTSPPLRAVVGQGLPGKNLVIGQVKILKRGEELSKPAAEPVKVEKKKGGVDLGSTNRLGPDPELGRTQIRLTESKDKVSAFYAGSAFTTSPPPSSVPLPAFFTKRCVVAAKTADATSDLRRILRLDL
ncbi:hypothetical protein SLE2022_185810 [Rubroshorea leprosula]